MGWFVGGHKRNAAARYKGYAVLPSHTGASSALRRRLAGATVSLGRDHDLLSVLGRERSLEPREATRPPSDRATTVPDNSNAAIENTFPNLAAARSKPFDTVKPSRR